MKSHDSDDDETNKNRPSVQMSNESMLQGDNSSESQRLTGIATSTSSANESSPAVVYHTIDALDDSVDLPEYVKEHQATLSFPEKVRFFMGHLEKIFSCNSPLFPKLMITLIHVERECAKQGKRPTCTDESIGWVLEGKAFVIRNKEKFTKTWVPMFFGQAKLSSFTRKLYRWGFRKLNLARDGTGSTQNAMYFGNENFQRDDTSLLSRMRSITAAKTRTEAALDASQNAHAMSESGGNPSHLSLPSHVVNALEVLLSSISQPMPTTNPSLRQDARAVESLSVMQQLGTLIENQQALGQQPVHFSLASTLRQGLSTVPHPLNSTILQPTCSLATMGVRDSTGLLVDQVSLLLGQLQQFNHLNQPIRQFSDQQQLQLQQGSNMQTLQSYLLSTHNAAQLPASMSQPSTVVAPPSQSQNLGLTRFDDGLQQSRNTSSDTWNLSSEREVVNEIINMLHRYNQSLDSRQNPPQPPF
jgi:HSF-type DNA-binding